MAYVGNNSSAPDAEKHGSPYQTTARSRIVDCLLRSLAFVGTLAASTVMATNKQTVSVVGVPLTAIYHHTPAFLYFVIANGICCGYLFVSLVLSVKDLLKPSDSPSSTRRLVFLLDVIMFGLVLSAASSASTVAYIGFKGDSHAGWHATCGVLDKFCHKGVGAGFGSFLAVGNFIALIIFPAYGSIN